MLDPWDQSSFPIGLEQRGGASSFKVIILLTITATWSELELITTLNIITIFHLFLPWIFSEFSLQTWITTVNESAYYCILRFFSAKYSHPVLLNSWSLKISENQQNIVNSFASMEQELIGMKSLFSFSLWMWCEQVPQAPTTSTSLPWQTGTGNWELKAFLQYVALFQVFCHTYGNETEMPPGQVSRADQDNTTSWGTCVETQQLVG